MVESNCCMNKATATIHGKKRSTCCCDGAAATLVIYDLRLMIYDLKDRKDQRDSIPSVLQPINHKSCDSLTPVALFSSGHKHYGCAASFSGYFGQTQS